jgi:hypothetical protein
MRHDTPQYRLIASCLAGASYVPGPDWDWDRTVQVAAREQVLPALHAKLPCPPEISDFFEAIHLLNAERNRQLLSEIETLASLLNRDGIEPVLLKGSAYLVAGVYPDSADRWLQDIDLLVGPTQSGQAFEIIRRSGYEPYAPKPSALARHHHPVLTHIQRFPVEVHHSLGLGACSTFLTADEVVNASSPFRFGQANVHIPSAEHLMTHLIMHSQMHHGSYDRIWPALRAMHDLVLLGRRFAVPWDSVRSRFRSHRKTALLNLHLMQIENTMGIAPPFTVSNGGIRWWYRQALWREPKLGYLDPVYFFSRVFSDKLQVSRRLLKDPVGRRFVLSAPFRRSFYKRILADITQG